MLKAIKKDYENDMYICAIEIFYIIFDSVISICCKFSIMKSYYKSVVL